MKQPTPLELLEKKVKEYEHDLQKSVVLFETDQLSPVQHAIHKSNLEPLIEQYKQAIIKLKS